MNISEADICDCMTQSVRQEPSANPLMNPLFYGRLRFARMPTDLRPQDRRQRSASSQLRQTANNQSISGSKQYIQNPPLHLNELAVV